MPCHKEKKVSKLIKIRVRNPGNLLIVHRTEPLQYAEIGQPSATSVFFAVLRILLGFSTDRNPDPGSQTNANPDPDPGEAVTKS